MASRTGSPQSRSRAWSGGSMPPRNASQSHASSIAAVRPASAFSLLLSLPRELRNRVYTAALAAPSLFSWPGPPPARRRHGVHVGLLRANRQVHDEAVAVLYRQNKLLFTHPSDLNIFRLVASPASQDMAAVYFRIREKDLGLWTSYLSSKSPERSLKADLPKLKSLWLFMRCGSMAAPAMLGHVQQLQPQPPFVHFAQGAQHNHHLFALPSTAALPPPPPSQPGQPTTHPLYTSFLRFEREMGIEWLCLSLQDTLSHTTGPEVKIVCIMRIPRHEVDRLARMYPDELSVDRNGDARTRFWKMRGVEVSLEFSGYVVPGEGRERDDGGDGE